MFRRCNTYFFPLIYSTDLVIYNWLNNSGYLTSFPFFPPPHVQCSTHTYSAHTHKRHAPTVSAGNMLHIPLLIFLFRNPRELLYFQIQNHLHLIMSRDALRTLINMQLDTKENTYGPSHFHT